MKRLWPFLLLLYSCTDEPPGKAAVSLNGIFHGEKPGKHADTLGSPVLVPWKILPEEEAASFLDAFEVIDPGDFYVSSYRDYSYKSENYRVFRGKPLHTKYSRLFSGLGIKREGMEIYACHKFMVDDSTIALLLRHPGKGISSSVSLCLWDRSARRLIPRCYLLSENNEKDLTRKDTRILRKDGGRVYLLNFFYKCMEEGGPCGETQSLYAISNRKFVKWKQKPAE